MLSDVSRLHQQNMVKLSNTGFFKKISEWCPCNRNVEKLINDQFAKYNNGGQYTLKLPPVTWKVFTRKCSRWLIMVMNYQRGDLYSFTCRKACSIHKTQKMLLLSYLMETVKFIFVPEIYPNFQLQSLWKKLYTLSLDDDESLDGDNNKHI